MSKRKHEPVAIVDDDGLTDAQRSRVTAIYDSFRGEDIMDSSVVIARVLSRMVADQGANDWPLTMRRLQMTINLVLSGAVAEYGERNNGITGEQLLEAQKMENTSAYVPLSTVVGVIAGYLTGKGILDTIEQRREIGEEMAKMVVGAINEEIKRQQHLLQHAAELIGLEVDAILRGDGEPKRAG